MKIKAIGLRLFRAKDALVVVGWGAALGNLAVTAVAHGILVPQAGFYSEGESSQTGLLLFALYYVGVFALSFLSGLVLRSISTALVGFFCAYGVGLLVTSLILDLPVITGFLTQSVQANLASGIIFSAFFPLALIVGLIGAILGSATVEQ